MPRHDKSEALAAVHETALGLREAGVMDTQTMRSFDELCLTPVGASEDDVPPAPHRARDPDAGMV